MMSPAGDGFSPRNSGCLLSPKFSEATHWLSAKSTIHFAVGERGVGAAWALPQEQANDARIAWNDLGFIGYASLLDY
jgi:hypothetical protein